MEIPFLNPMSQRAYHSPSSHYEDDDIMSSSSYNLPVSNTSGSTITYEPTPSGRNSAAPRQRVREMVKMFEGSTPSAATTPVHRAETSGFTSTKPYYVGAVRGNANSNFGGSQASVKQYVTQFQEGDEPVKGNEKNRRNAGVGRGGFVTKHYAPQYQDVDEQAKRTDKTRRLTGAGCAAVTGYGGVPPNQAKQFLPQYHEADCDSAKVTERCQCCNVLYRCDEVHYCLGNKKGCTPMEQNHVTRTELECNNAGIRQNNGFKIGPYAGFVENRNNDMLRSPTKELSETKAREQRRNPAELYDDIDGIPVSLAYDSKTTILRTQDGVRIVVDISIDSMSSLSAADVICSRVETEMPHSRILTEFQQKSAMIMAGEDNRM